MFLWDSTKDGTSWGNGSSCYSYDEAPCDADLTKNKPWRSVNLNYDTPKTGTLFSHSTNFLCPGYKSSKSGSTKMMGSAAMIMGIGGAAALF